MAAIAIFSGCGHKSRDSTPCNAIGILGVIGCFVAIIDTAAVSIVSNHGTLIVLQHKHRTTKAFVGPSHFRSHTSLVTSVVYSSASASRKRSAVRGAALQFLLDALIISCRIMRRRLI